ncbi:MAG: hypothetical protein LH630_08420, partial [Actinomycetia bacterium]|nr:hypothetical protein [Actinomycetes bacterium]
DHVEVWLIDSPDPEANPNLEFVIDDAERRSSYGRRDAVCCCTASATACNAPLTAVAVERLQL